MDKIEITVFGQTFKATGLIAVMLATLIVLIVLG